MIIYLNRTTKTVQYGKTRKMLSTLLGTIGAITVVLGIWNILHDCNVNKVIVETMLYIGVSTLIGFPYIAVGKALFGPSTLFLMNVLGLIALPAAEYLTAYYHFVPYNHSIWTLNAIVGFTTGILAIIIAKLQASQLISAYSILALYCGLNNLLLAIYVDIYTFDAFLLVNTTISLLGIVLFCVMIFQKY